MRRCCSFLTCILLSPPFPDNFPWPSISSTLLTRAEDDLSSWLFLLFSLYSRRFSPLMLFDSLILFLPAPSLPFPIIEHRRHLWFSKGICLFIMFSAIPFSVLLCLSSVVFRQPSRQNPQKQRKIVSTRKLYIWSYFFSPGLGFFYTSTSSS